MRKAEKARDEKIGKKARKETYDENVRSLSPFLLDLLVAFAIGWLSLATERRTRRRVAEGDHPEDAGMTEVRVGKLTTRWVVDRESEPGRKGWRSSDAAADDNDDDDDDDDGRQHRWLSREDRRHSE